MEELKVHSYQIYNFCTVLRRHKLIRAIAFSVYDLQSWQIVSAFHIMSPLLAKVKS